MTFPTVTVAEWRAQIDKELAAHGSSFDKALVHETPEGLAIAPLYTEAPPGDVLERARAHAAAVAGFRICVRLPAGGGADALDAELDGGADGLWMRLDETFDRAVARRDLSPASFVFDTDGAGAGGHVERAEALDRIAAHLDPKTAPSFSLNRDPLARRARGLGTFETLPAELTSLGDTARALGPFADATSVMVSTLAYHEAGADAAEELALALSTGVAYLDALLGSGLSAADAARQIAVQLAVGRDTFLELCKLRALRVCWQKLLAASGAAGSPRRTRVHAVCSARTLTVRDPWVNMLRVTTQVFSAVLGGADLVTPAAFDDASGSASALGRRVARNTGLVLREESFLGKVADPGGGSYYLETLTDALAREAWRRFRQIERDGGIAKALESGSLKARLESAWRARLAAIATRRVAILGVSEFANLDEELPRPAPGPRPPTDPGALPAHRDAEAFEALRRRADANTTATRRDAVLVTLGTSADSRPRAGFAAGFFAAGGIHTREASADSADARARIACLCGTDERYASEAVTRARALKAAGCERVLLAGRPGALEPALREAGVDGFLFVGCDVVATLDGLLGGE